MKNYRNTIASLCLTLAFVASNDLSTFTFAKKTKKVYPLDQEAVD